MIKLYVRLIIAGRKTIDDVPESIRAEVEAALAQYPDIPENEYIGYYKAMTAEIEG